MAKIQDHWSELEEIALIFSSHFHHIHKTVSIARKSAGVTDRLNSYPPFGLSDCWPREGPLPVTEIGLRLDIAKSNVSALCQQTGGPGNVGTYTRHG